MKWLVTVKRTADLGRITQRISELGGEPVAEEPPVPLGPDEVVLSISGPKELAAKLQNESQIVEIHPSSEMEYL